MIDFLTKANASLAELEKQGFPTDKIARLRKKLAAKVKLPSDEDVREFNATMVACFGKENEYLYEPFRN